MQQHSFFIKE